MHPLDSPDAERSRRGAVIAILLAAIGAAAAIGLALFSLSNPSTPSTRTAASSGARSAQSSAQSSDPPAAPPHDRSSARDGAIGPDDGIVPDGTTVFDDGVPAIDGLDAGLLEALREAATDAAADGVEFAVNSGWRSAAYQEQLLGDAVAEYGSEEEAAKWVATPETSAHVSGDAVDLGAAAAAWLSEHGARYGLCQIYANESWHYELRPEAVRRGCPAMREDAAQDSPRRG